VNSEQHPSSAPQVKICGLTDVDQALGCVRLGASAIGCVFYPKSPRYVSERRAREVVESLPAGVKSVGVFFNETFPAIMRKVERCGLTAVQLHGQETPELVRELKQERLLVIKALFVKQDPLITAADKYTADAFLVEYAQAALPGGNALAWEWGQAGVMDRKRPLILAGGLEPDNVWEAVGACLPSAVDISSGVESAPGVKDLNKVGAFIRTVSRCGKLYAERGEKLSKIF